MPLHTTYYFGTLRKIIVAFGSLFNDINIVRFDVNGNPIKTIKVPLAYGPKQKWVQRINQRNSITSTRNKTVDVGMTMPRMAFELTRIEYDPARQTNPLQKRAVTNPADSNRRLYQRNPVPYDISFNLHILVKNVDDGMQIVEQILPYFTPDYAVTIKEVPQLDVDRDVSIIYAGMSSEDSYEGSFQDMRVVTWTLQFVAKAYFYPPITDGSIIKTIYDNFYTQPDMQTVEASVSLAVNPKTANKEDDYEVIVSIDAKPVYDSNGQLIHFVALDGTILTPS